MEVVTVVVGAALLALGAVGATVTQRRLEGDGQARRIPLALVPFGVLVGAGAAVIRGWDLVVSLVAGAVVLPLVGTVARLLEVRRRRRRRGS